MKKFLPFRSLVIYFNSLDLSNFFDDHEKMSFQIVKNDLIGDQHRPELDIIIKNETFRRISLKLSLGERILFDGTYLSKNERLSLAKVARLQGSPVFYIVEKIDNFYEDDYGEIIVFPDFETVKNISLNELHKKFNGLTVVGDVHGNIDALESAVSWAQSRNNYLLFLGDTIDYGPYPIEVLNRIYDLIMDGLATTLIGNHERKIARWIHSKEENTKTKIKLSEGNRVTIDALSRMSLEDRTSWIGKFKSVIARASLILNIQNFTFAHAAIHPDYWLNYDYYEIENYALYGEPDPTSYPDFKLGHTWLNHVPNEKIVIVGHEAHTFLFPLVYPCNSGGKVIFLDTGCGKGGPLSTADLIFDHNKKLVLGNFNRHLGKR